MIPIFMTFTQLTHGKVLSSFPDLVAGAFSEAGGATEDVKLTLVEVPGLPGGEATVQGTADL